MEKYIQEQDIMEIEEKGWRENFGQYRITNRVKNISVSNKSELLKVIYKAKQEKWEALDLSQCDLTEIPPEIGELVDLKMLSVSSQNDDIGITLPREICKLKNLEVFDAYYAKMGALPEEFGELNKLRVLGLNDNLFKEFPEVICKFSRLEFLAINGEFVELPNEIWNLVNLKNLYLPQVKINSLPEEIGNLTKLEVLCIWGSKVSKLPNSIRNLVNIKKLYLTKSIFQDIIPPEIVNQSPIDAINYILKYQSDDEKIEVNESKMIIVGQGGVGKSCLLNRLVNNDYDELKSTEGIDIAPWEFFGNDKKYKLNVWDFGGQEIYHATHQFFLTNRSLYIFVWDARQEEEYGRIDYWLNTIESFANDSPILIVVNKCDSRNSIKHIDLKSLKERFPQIIDSFKVSCKENVNINNLKEAIEEETTKLPLMGMVWLSTWLKVRNQLEYMSKSKNIISFSEYLNICSEHKVLNGEAISLSKYLHDLGIIINFQDDIFLKDIVILNPEWGTNAVYKVLDAEENVLKDRNGTLRYEDLPLIWNDNSLYPTEIYPIILRLMENFQLSFEVTKNKEYLIAELLENEEILIDFDYEDKRALNFQYNYEFLPAGIFTRFIVKSHAHLVEVNSKKACWKKGAYLKYKQAYGIVKLFDGIKERRIEINILGNNARNKRELLGIIRNIFEEIHNNIPKLKYTENIKCNCAKNCTYLHDYNYLIKLEEHNIYQERCKHSLKSVNVSKLLDGIESSNKRHNERGRFMRNINISPKIEITNTNTNTNNNENKISIDIKNCINELQGNINDLKDEVVPVNPGLEKEFTKLEASVEKLDKATNKEEVVKSGALNKIKRFLDEVQDSESDIGKTIKNIKYGLNIAKNIAEKYNSIAEWCGMPVIPKVFLKK